MHAGTKRLILKGGNGGGKWLLPLLIVLLGWNSAMALDLVLQPGRKLGAQLQALEGSRVRVAYQYGLGYLPLMLMRQHRLIEKHASTMGLGPIDVKWNRFPSGRAMNAALKAGLLDFGSGGVVPMVKAWSDSREGAQIRGVASLGSMPLTLVSNRRELKRLTDFGEADRIAVPDTHGSMQAVLLRMAAAKAFGPQHFRRLNSNMVSMSHPEGERALLADPPTISAHLSGPPFQNQELMSRSTQKVLSSYEVLDGASSYNLLWTSNVYRKVNPKTVRAVYAAAQQAMAIINDDPDYAARVYLQQSNSPQSVEFIRRIIAAPEVDFTIVPQNTMGFAEFMAQSGDIPAPPADWRELFFDHIYGEPGS